ncbi:hypothetical protein ACWJJH_16875 [Endozoicomonadaceae bacterium StTr2]
MDILALLTKMKGRTLGFAEFEQLKQAFTKQDEHITRLEENNARLQRQLESCSSELQKIKSGKIIMHGLLPEPAMQATSPVPPEPLSRIAANVFVRIIEKDRDYFYKTSVIKMMKLGTLKTEAALDELEDHGLIKSHSINSTYGMYYRLTPKAKRTLIKERPQ